jgi:hypothetical protein
MIYDLHSHSTASDGTLTPTELVTRARANGVTTLALTDHDTVAGVAEAQAAGTRLGVTVVPGVELSATWAGKTLHIVGLALDPNTPALQRGLDRLQAQRTARAHRIAERLERLGVQDALARAQAQTGPGGEVTRTHFARALVEAGWAKTTQKALERYLLQRKPGYVPTQWPPLEEVVGWIRAAGGLAVIAHPGRYRLTGVKLTALAEAFTAAGGQGIEVVAGNHDRNQIATAARLAERHGLYASCGSDFHTPDSPWIELGRLVALPAACTPIWRAWEPEPAAAVC